MFVNNCGTDSGNANLGQLLQSSRMAALLSQEELAARSGLSVRTIRNLERGRVSIPRGESIRLLADALEMDDRTRDTFMRSRPVLVSDDRAAVTVEHQPSEHVQFTAWKELLGQLQDLIRVLPPGKRIIAAVHGVAGAGKTALAVHLATKIADQFPDGQLYLNLGATRPAPLTPADVVGGLLGGLGVDPVPARFADRITAFRSHLDGRRLFIVLDDANEEQVSPLVSPSSGSVVVVTSRFRLEGLAKATHFALDGAGSAPALALALAAAADSGQPPAGTPSRSRSMPRRPGHEQQLGRARRRIVHLDSAAPASAAVPSQLPTDIAVFAGRRDEIATLDRIVADGNAQPTATTIVALSGGAGVGKTALAVHWAHRVRDTFPDGQMYLDLGGFGPAMSPMEPAEATGVFLSALGVPDARIPAGLVARTTLYRSMLAGRRALVVLDNARDADQVRPLLPGTGGCVVVLTSRTQLSALVEMEGAYSMNVGLPTDEDAHELIARRIGLDRAGVESAAVSEIVAQCGRLPSAMATVATRAAMSPQFPLSTLAAELRVAEGSLDAFLRRDVATSIRTAFSWSYLALSPDAATLFRSFGRGTADDMTTAAAMVLTGMPEDRVQNALTELCRAHLVTEHRPYRYTMHKLSRAYAAELMTESFSLPHRESPHDEVTWFRLA
jgi:transcriptional regulator with XRE-family HTH domain